MEPKHSSVWGGMQQRKRSLDEVNFNRFDAKCTLLVGGHHGLRLQRLHRGFVGCNVLGNRDAVDALECFNDTSLSGMLLSMSNVTRFRQPGIPAVGDVLTRVADHRPRQIAELLPWHRKPVELKCPARLGVFTKRLPIAVRPRTYSIFIAPNFPGGIRMSPIIYSSMVSQFE